MNKGSPRNIAASVHQRLLNIAKESNRPFAEVLQYFAMERILYRLCATEHANAFVLKGALLFRIWDVPDSRATRDIDFLAHIDNTPNRLASVFREVCGIDGEDDGLIFDADTVETHTIKEDAEYQGVRIRFLGYLENARINMQIDVGFGDTVHPEAKLAQYPVLLNHPAPTLRIYPPETVVAEKAEAMVHLGSLNSRMKDFYDIWRMARLFDFDGATLGEAMRLTFTNRDTAIMEFDEA